MTRRQQIEVRVIIKDIQKDLKQHISKYHVEGYHYIQKLVDFPICPKIYKNICTQ